MISTTCPRCQRSFMVEAYRLRGEARPLCSIACRKTGRVVACATCGAREYRSAAQERGSRTFCSRACAAPTRLKLGGAPWNRDLKGIHLSPSSEFAPGIIPANKLDLGATTIRVDKQGRLRAWVKVAEPNVWQPRARVVWESANGPMTRGMLIHHHDRDTLNDELSNLRMLTPAQHLLEHKDEFEDERRENAAIANRSRDRRRAA